MIDIGDSLQVKRQKREKRRKTFMCKSYHCQNIALIFIVINGEMYPNI